jgi:hypothetical protein
MLDDLATHFDHVLLDPNAQYVSAGEEEDSEAEVRHPLSMHCG